MLQQPKPPTETTPALRALDADKLFGSADDLIAFLNEVAASGWQLCMDPRAGENGQWRGSLAKDFDRLSLDGESFWGVLSGLRFKFARLSGVNLGPTR